MNPNRGIRDLRCFNETHGSENPNENNPMFSLRCCLPFIFINFLHLAQLIQYQQRKRMLLYCRFDISFFILLVLFFGTTIDRCSGSVSDSSDKDALILSRALQNTNMETASATFASLMANMTEDCAAEAATWQSCVKATCPDSNICGKLQRNVSFGVVLSTQLCLRPDIIFLQKKSSTHKLSAPR